MSHLSAVLVFALISFSAAGPTESRYRFRKYTQSRDMLQSITVVSCFYHSSIYPCFHWQFMRDSQLSGVQFLGVCVFFYNIPADDSARFQETRLPYFGREITGRFQSYPFGTTQVGLSIASQIVSNRVSCDVVTLLFHI